ncbi:hypothetical protein [Aquabacterium sp.]|uniref:hypothetical protein n=1 Tax=Aquabacterium sp. TaxID=1872578 RepID=UPI002487337B|nr:hypothetical protein [Aquabacterium sp.]MDI1260279.1 hypothetical protein [Aquabacterium sp.]
MVSKTVRAFAFCLALLGLHGAAMSQVAKSVAEGLMRKSGLCEQLGSIGPQMEVGLAATAERSAAKISPDELKSLGQAFAAAYSPLHLCSACLGVMADPQARVQAGAMVLSSATADRLALLKRFTVATRAAEASVDIIINTAIGMQEGLAKVSSAGQKPQVKAMRAALEQPRPKLQESFEGMMLALSASTYESVNDETFDRYVDFLQSPAGRHYNDVALRAIDRVFVKAARYVGHGMPAIKSKANL